MDEQKEDFNEVKAEAEVKQESGSPEQEKMSSVIIRPQLRQVITTAGTIEESVEEPKIEQVVAEEIVKTSTSTPISGSPQEPTSVPPQEVQQYEEQPQQTEEHYEVEQQQQHFQEQAVVAAEQYPVTTQEYQVQEQPIEYTTSVEVASMQGTVPHIQIEGAHYGEAQQEETKVGVEYTNLDTVPSAQYQQAGHFSNDGSPFIHQQQQPFQQFQNYGIARGPEDSPPSSVLYKNDPNLASSRMYQVSLNLLSGDT